MALAAGRSVKVVRPAASICLKIVCANTSSPLHTIAAAHIVDIMCLRDMMTLAVPALLEELAPASLCNPLQSDGLYAFGHIQQQARSGHCCAGRANFSGRLVHR